MTLPSGKYDVELVDVSVAYQDNIVLENITMTVETGSFWGIIGPNGSGKSTLIKTILGLLTPVQGIVRTFGKLPSQLKEMRALIGYVPQYAQIDFSFPLRVLDVVAMGLYGKIGLLKPLTKEHKEAAYQALDRVQMIDYAKRQISELSGGQRQRILIARALVVEPKLLVLDEPTAALDHTATEGLYEWLNGINISHGMTILLVSHDIGVVSHYVHSIACLNRKLVAHGKPADVFTIPVLEAMYGCGAVIFQHGHIPHMVVEHKPHHET